MKAWQFGGMMVGLALAGPVGADSETPAPADLVVLNAVVITVDDQRPEAEAVAVKAGRFLAVGTTADVRRLIGPQTRVIDAHGKTLTPGFNDAHCHPRPVYPEDSPFASVELRPEKTPDLDALIAALRAKAARTPPGQWVRGSRYEDTKLGRHPTRADLDRVSTEHPVWITHSSGHVSAFNSLALETAGIDANTPDPPGGAFDRDADGNPTGVCREGSAVRLVTRAGPRSPEPTLDDEVAGLVRCLNDFARAGITSVGVAGGSPDSLRLYQLARDAGNPVRVYLFLSDAYLDQLADLGLRAGFGDERIRLGAIKLFHGNSLSGQTCWVSEPYEGRPDYHGIPPARSQQTLDALIGRIHDAGLQAAVHANGDREIDMVLTAIEHALERHPRNNHRHRIEHGSIVTEELLDRMKRLGVVLAPHSYIYEHGDKMEAYGAWRWTWMEPNRLAIDRGIPVAGNSDWGVSAALPMRRIQSLVTRASREGKVYGPERRLTVDEAIRTWTLGGAYASFEEDLKGSITVGKLADAVLLSADPRAVPPDQIEHIAVEMTIIGGHIVHDATHSD